MALNEHFFESLLAQMPGDFVVLDLDFRYVYVNPKAVRDPEIRKWIIGKTDDEYCEYRNVNKGVAEARRAMLRKVVETKKEVELEECLKDKDGNCRYYVRRITPYLDQHGNFTHFLGYGIEVTEQKKISAELVDSRNFIQQILDASPQMIFVKDKTGNIIQGNKALIDLLKVNPSDLPSKDLSKNYKNQQEYVEHIAADKKVIDEGVMVRVEETFTDADGKLFYFDAIKVPFPGLNGERNVLCVATDITDQKKSREELMESQRLLYNAERLTKAGNYQFDFVSGKITWSPGVYLIWERLESLGPPSYEEFLQYVHPDDHAIIHENMRIIVEEKKAYNSTYRIICPNGKVKFIQTSSQLKFNEAGDVFGLEGSLIDITDQKNAEAEIIKAKQIAEESVSVKEKFMANLGHEMRTPLNGVLGMSRLLQKTQLSQTQKKYINVLNSTAENLLVIINDLLDVAKIESGTLNFDKVTFDINQVADTAIQIKMSAAEEKGLVLKHLTDNNSETKLIGDPYRINQILLNLVGNAIKFTHEGEVSLSHHVFKKENGTVWIRFLVKDTGIGIPKSKLKDIFNSFTQVNTINQKTTEGLGLGLSIVRSIVEQMGGEINVTSVVGEGSEFSVVIPFEISGEVEMIMNDTSERLMMSSLRVLLAEDNLVNQFIVQAMLQDWGFNVDTASNGRDAIELFKANNYEVILMDIQMPFMDGMEATEFIRQYEDDKKAKTPIIALTANPSKHYQKKYINAGMDDVIVKPFKEELLYKKIVALCSGNSDLIKVVKRKYPTRKKPETVKNKLYDLTFLEKEIGDNKEIMQRMLCIFVETIPDTLGKMNTHFVNGEMDAIATLAHKIKPTIDGAGIKSIYDTIRHVEGYRELKRTTDQMKSDLTKIEKVLLSVVEEFKIEINAFKESTLVAN
ncbi:MAG: response regulator [Bacteroidota bacterium]